MLPVFLSPFLLWGLALLAVPVLIHLINLLRQRRVQWAAMEFLIKSQKRNRRWVMIRQLLLLLARMAALALIVLALAQPALRNRLAQLFGSTTTHHVVLLDDSFSMQDRWADTSGFARGKDVVRTLATQAAGQGVAQQLTLLRFSQAQAGKPDLLTELVSTDLPDRLDDRLRPMAASELAVGPAEALTALDELLGVPEGETRIIYLVSDFRAPQWQDPRAIAQALKKAQQAGARLELISVVDERHSNVAIVGLRAQSGTRAAGVPLFMEVAVQNLSDAAVADVAVTLEEDGSPRPALHIDAIAPGKTETRRFPVRFTTAGQHVVTARLESDALDVDNNRWCAIDLPLVVPVLIVDGDAAGDDAELLTLALAPGGPVATGVSPRVESPRFLSTQPLDEFKVIYLTNVGRLDEAAVKALEGFVERGGGLAYFAGDLADPQFLSGDLYREGQGLFPLPVGPPVELVVDRVQRANDLEVTDHPIFGIFAGERNSFLGAVLIERYLPAKDGWEPTPDSTVKVLAKLRNGAPLAVERRYGEGRVVAFLTTASPEWNNWARNPSFVVTMLELQAYLTHQPPADDALRVGQPLEVKFAAADYDPQVRFIAPKQDQAAPQVVDGVRKDDLFIATLADTGVAGVYDAELTAAGGEGEVRRFALNVAPEESDLSQLNAEQLASRLNGIPYSFYQADDFELVSTEAAGLQLSDTLLYLLIALLVGEQLLAYSASYHAKKPRGAS